VTQSGRRIYDVIKNSCLLIRYHLNMALEYRQCSGRFTYPLTTGLSRSFAALYSIRFSSDTNGMILGANFRPITASINLSEFGAEEADQAGIVDPDQQNYK
jgi:hypothetical protein